VFEFTEKNVHDLLTGRLGLSEADASGMIPEVLAMQPPIKEAFSRWLDTGTLPDQPKYEGYSAQSLATGQGLQPVAAFLTLDWLATDPEIAKKAISEGYDQVFPE
jgi:hypothetical protein